MNFLPMPLPDLIATEKLARKIAPFLQEGDMLALYGALGAGKTTFARTLLQALGVTEDVPSPTFTLLQNYDTPRFPVAHIDLYRLKSEEELDELGWDDLCADHVVLAEWPERAGARLPKSRLELHFMLDGDGKRSCRIGVFGVWQQRLKDFP